MANTPSLKIYVAGNFATDRERCRSIAITLERLGHEITVKWFDTEPKDFGAHNSLIDYRGVRNADVLIVLMDQERDFRGTWCEVGAAHILGKPVYFIGDAYRDANVFRKHPLSLNFYTDWFWTKEIAAVEKARTISVALLPSGEYAPRVAYTAEDAKKVNKCIHKYVCFSSNILICPNCNNKIHKGSVEHKQWKHVFNEFNDCICGFRKPSVAL